MTITRVGTNGQYAAGWDAIFTKGQKKSLTKSSSPNSAKSVAVRTGLGTSKKAAAKVGPSKGAAKKGSVKKSAKKVLAKKK